MNSNSKHRQSPDVLVIAHDAGAAEIVAGYLRAHIGRYNFLSYVAGPAIGIFRREHIQSIVIQRKDLSRIIENHRNVTYALVGTGHPRSLELAAIKELKRQRIKTFAYIDSWKRYRERFGYPARNWRQNLPDQIWVGDAMARKIARQYFPAGLIRLVPNEYFKRIAMRYRLLKREIRRAPILFFSVADPESYDVLKVLLEHVADIKKSLTVRIRFHPVDDQKRYSNLIQQYRNRVRIEISNEKDIVRDLARARAAIGYETTALVAAGLVGIPTISVSPRSIVLPFSPMMHARNPQAAARKMLRIVGSKRV